MKRLIVTMLGAVIGAGFALWIFHAVNLIGRSEKASNIILKERTALFMHLTESQKVILKNQEKLTSITLRQDLILSKINDILARLPDVPPQKAIDGPGKVRIPAENSH